MTTFLKIEDGLKRSLGYLDEDDSLDSAEIKRMTASLMVAELYVQGAIGRDNLDFYQFDEIRPLYIQACNSLAATYFQNPATVGSNANMVNDAVSNAIIGQLRGRYDEVMQNGTNNKS